jgi:hypothetical protein
MTEKRDDTVGQPRRASDSQPRPNTGTPSLGEPAKRDIRSTKRDNGGHLKPCDSWSPIDSGRATK